MWKNFLFAIAGVIIIGIAGASTYYFLSSKDSRPSRQKNIADNQSQIVSSNSTITNTDTADSDTADQPLYLATMTHMEGNHKDDVLESVFLEHVEQLRYGMALADEYGAKLTIESEKPFARANTVWGLNLLQEIVDKGHGVGTHCDIGANEKNLSVEDFTALFRENKTLVDALVGAEQNKGCSGGGSATDWVLAASQAGFSYIDGVVGFHYLAMPIKNRPSTTWTDQYIRTEAFHENAPFDLEDRIYLRMLANAQDFEHDEDGVLVVSAGSLGRLDMIAETNGDLTLCEKEKNCPLTAEDVTALVEQIRMIDTGRDRSTVAKIDVYFPASTWMPENETVLRAFFEAMQTLEEEGVVQWATQLEVYEAYIASNS